MIEFYGLDAHIEKIKEIANKLDDIQELADVVGQTIVSQTQDRLLDQVDVEGNKMPTKQPSTLLKNKGHEKWGIDSGTLMKAITYEVQGNKLIVGDNLHYSKYIQEGTKPHTIMARNARALKFQIKTGETVFRKKVNHPGTPPATFYGITKENEEEIQNAIVDWIFD